MDTQPGSVRHVRVDEPAAATSVSAADTTVVNVGPERPLPPDGRPPGPPWPLIAMVAGVVLIGLLGWWWVTSQRQATVTAAATATAVAQATTTAAAQATATAESALASQRAAEAAQAAVQATSVAQATAATNAQVAAQRVAADATAAAEAARVAPTVPPPPPATPVVVVVTATPVPAPPPPPPAPAPLPPAVTEAAPPQSPLGAIPPAPPVRQPAAPTFAPGPARPIGAPPAVAGASPAPSPAVAGPAPTPTSVTTTPGQPLLLRCLGDRVQVSAAPDAVPAQTTVSCRPMDAGSIPPPPGPVIDDTLFEINVEVRNGRELSSPLDLQVVYAVNAVPPAERSTLKLGFFDGRNWSAVREQTADQAARRISGKITEGGTFGLYRQP